MIELEVAWRVKYKTGTEFVIDWVDVKDRVGVIKILVMEKERLYRCGDFEEGHNFEAAINLLLK